MKYFVTAHAPVFIANPLDGTPSTDTVGWDVFIRALFQDERWMQQLDVFSANDLRTKLLSLKPGQVAELTENEHAAAKTIVMHPRTLSPAFVYSAEGMLRAIADAPTKDPRAKKEKV